MSNMFGGFRDIWEPVIDPATRIPHSKMMGELPAPFHKKGETLEFMGVQTTRKQVFYGIREDGPDAWGASLNINENVMFRWLNSKDGAADWYLTTERCHISVSSCNRYLETIEIKEDDTIEWKLYCFEEYDET